MKAKISTILFSLLILTLLTLSCSSAGNSSSSEPINPKPGVWEATTEDGSFTFVVNKKGTGINEYDFGGVNVKTDDEDGYPIIDSKFGSVLSGVSIEGEFTGNTTATGTWKNNSGSGTWTAKWSGE